MQEKLNSLLQKGKQIIKKYVLKKGRVICVCAVISIASMPCRSTTIDGFNVTVMNPDLLTNLDKTDIDNIEVEEVVSKNLVTPTPTVAPTIAPMPTTVPTPTLTPEEKKLKEYESYFKMYDYCYIEANRDRYLAYLEKFPGTPVIDAMTYVNIGLDNAYYTNITDIVNPSSPLAICNKYNKLPSDYVPEGFSKDTKKTTVLHGDAGEAYDKMVKAAKKDGLKIYSISSYRSYKYQKERYDEKVRARGQADVDKTNAKPGHSGHQLALVADFSNGNSEYDLDESFANTKEGKWLAENAYKYGYILRYPKGKDKEYITGYSYEPWHYRYVGVKIATIIHKTGLTYEEFYARYVKKVVLENPEASKLSGDQFFDKYLSKYFVKGQVFIDNVSMDKGLIKDLNVALAKLSGYQFAVSNGYIDKEDDEVLVLSNTK